MTRDRISNDARGRGLTLLAAGIALLFAPVPALGQRIGLFFDSAATLCNAPLASFDTVRVYVVGFPPADSLLGGAFFSLERPPSLEILPGSVRVRREVVFDVIGDLAEVSDLDVRFRDCVLPSEPLPLLEFVVFEGSLAQRSDLSMRLIGAGTDSLALSKPHWKVCDPADPERFTSLVTAPSVDVVFNCTHACYCTTAVQNKTWAAVKSLYQGN